MNKYILLKISLLLILATNNALASCTSKAQLQTPAQVLQCLENLIIDQETRIKKLEGEKKQLYQRAKTAVFRSICYGGIDVRSYPSIILVPLPNYLVNLDQTCKTTINSNWQGHGIAKIGHRTKNCTEVTLTDSMDYTSFVHGKEFHNHRQRYSNCNASNAVICCVSR